MTFVNLMVLTKGQKNYIITFIEDLSRYTFVYLMSNKDKSFDFFKHFIVEVENQEEKKKKMLRIDGGGECFLIEFSSYCEDGIIYHKTIFLHSITKWFGTKKKGFLLI